MIKNKSKYQFQYILNSVFVISLVLLLLNDFFFKSIFDNWITGKLSDFAGIAVFVLFFSVFIKNKKVVFINSAILFTFWKSEFSQSFINFWNQLPVLKIDRVVDYSDLFCLLVLIPLFYYNPIKIDFRSNFIKKSIAYPLVIVTIFSITATSRMKGFLAPSHIYINETVKLKSTKESFFNKLKNNNVNCVFDTILVVKNHTLEKYILENIIIEKDTLTETYIGIVEKRRKIKINIEKIKPKKYSNYHHLITSSRLEKLSKDYGEKVTNFLKELD